MTEETDELGFITDIADTNKVKVFERNGHIYFYDDVSEDSILKLIELSEAIVNKGWVKGNKPEYHLHICSCGGEAKAMTVFQDYLEFTIIPNTNNATVYIEGGASSAASIIAVMFPVRVINSRAYIMIHEIQRYDPKQRTFTHLDTRQKHLSMLEQQVVDTYVRYTKLPESKIKELLLTEAFFGPDQALEWGFVDKIQGRE